MHDHSVPGSAAEIPVDDFGNFEDPRDFFPHHFGVERDVSNAHGGQQGWMGRGRGGRFGAMMFGPHMMHGMQRGGRWGMRGGGGGHRGRGRGGFRGRRWRDFVFGDEASMASMADHFESCHLDEGCGGRDGEDSSSSASSSSSSSSSSSESESEAEEEIVHEKGGKNTNQPGAANQGEGDVPHGEGDDVTHQATPNHPDQPEEAKQAKDPQRSRGRHNKGRRHRDGHKHHHGNHKHRHHHHWQHPAALHHMMHPPPHHGFFDGPPHHFQPFPHHFPGYHGYHAPQHSKKFTKMMKKGRKLQKKAWKIQARIERHYHIVQGSDGGEVVHDIEDDIHQQFPPPWVFFQHARRLHGRHRSCCGAKKCQKEKRHGKGRSGRQEPSAEGDNETEFVRDVSCDIIDADGGEDQSPMDDVTEQTTAKKDITSQ